MCQICIWRLVQLCIWSTCTVCKCFWVPTLTNKLFDYGSKARQLYLSQRSWRSRATFRYHGRDHRVPRQDSGRRQTQFLRVLLADRKEVQCANHCTANSRISEDKPPLSYCESQTGQTTNMWSLASIVLLLKTPLKCDVDWWELNTASEAHKIYSDQSGN